MKLNMQILYDELRAYSGNAVLGNHTQLDLLGPRLLPGLDMPLSPNYVYLCTSSDLRQILVRTARQPLKFICTGELNLQNVEWQIIFVRGNQQPAETFEIVQEIFEKYSVWDHELAEAAMVPNNIQRLLDVGAQYLWNPIAVTDLAWHDLARAGQFVSSASTWGSLDSGYADLSRSSDQELVETWEMLQTNREPFFTPSTQGNAQYLMAPIYYKGTLFGVMKTNDMNQPITRGQLSLIAHIQHWFERTMAFSPIALPPAEEDLVHADMLLNNVPVDPNHVAQDLSRRGWSRSDSYRLYAIRLYNGANIGRQRSYSYRSRLQNIFPGSIIFIQEPYIILLRHADAAAKIPETIPEVSDLLQQLKLHAGASMQFQDYLQLSSAFFQATKALELSEQHEKNQPVSDILSYYADYLVSVLTQSGDLIAMCHAGILSYVQRGGQRELDHIRSLQEYLFRGRNSSATAAALYIHRNTLHNHLEHIQRYIGVDLEALDQETALCLYLSCLVAQRKFADVPKDASK